MPNIITGFCREVVIFTAMQLNKNIKIFFNYFLGPLLFAWLAFSIYRQIRHQPQLEASWLQVKASFNSYKISYLIAALFLILVNWGVEAWKWKISVATFYPIKFIQAFKAVLSGVTFSVSMPNRVGEYLGRVLYLPEGSRLKTISVTLVGSFAQVLVTLGVGMAGLIVLRGPLLNAYPQIVIWYQFIFYGLLALILILILLYFNVAGAVFLFQRWVKSNKYLYLIESLRNFSVQLLLKILLLSLLRYGVFVVQYILIFYLFGVNVSVATVVSVMSVVFLAMAIIPSVALVEVGMRSEISLKLMGVFSANSLGIGLTSVTVWFINLIIPAIVGSLLILNIKIFAKRNGEV